MSVFLLRYPALCCVTLVYQTYKNACRFASIFAKIHNESFLHDSCKKRDSKTMRIPVYKSCSLEIKDVDTLKGIVSGYFSAFNNTDYNKDIILPGAYKKTIAERGPKPGRDSDIHHLLEHDTGEPIGKLLELYEDSVGLAFVSQISKAGKGPDTLIRYQEKIYNQHSVGIYVDPAKSQKDSSGNRILKELMLIEGSTVLMGANPKTPVTGIKSATGIYDLIAKKARIEAYLKSGQSGTDELFLELEAELKLYADLLSDLLALKATQPEKATEPDTKKADADAIAAAISIRLKNL